MIAHVRIWNYAGVAFRIYDLCGVWMASTTNKGQASECFKMFQVLCKSLNTDMRHEYTLEPT